MTAFPYQLRKLRPGDAEWGTARAHLVAYRDELGVDLSLQGFAEELADLAAAYRPPGGLWLAKQGGEMVGSVALRALEGGRGELKRLFVVPAARGQGLARALVESALRSAREAGMRAVRLDTLSGMRQAQALYRALGFLPIPPYGPQLLPGAQCFELKLAEGAV
jgi:ribosomal protein S18 acetylase RimI-like enzyme